MTGRPLFDPHRQTLAIAPQARRQMAAWELDEAAVAGVLGQPEAVLRDDGRLVRVLRRLPIASREEPCAVIVACRWTAPDRLQVDAIHVQGHSGPLPLWVHVLRLPFYIVNRTINRMTAARGQW